MINGLSLIGCLWLILLSASSTLATEKENLWSRNIMICKNSECSIDKITWESNQEYNNYQGNVCWIYFFIPRKRLVAITKHSRRAVVQPRVYVPNQQV